MHQLQLQVPQEPQARHKLIVGDEKTLSTTRLRAAVLPSAFLRSCTFFPQPSCSHNCLSQDPLASPVRHNFPVPCSVSLSFFPFPSLLPDVLFFAPRVLLSQFLPPSQHLRPTKGMGARYPGLHLGRFDGGSGVCLPRSDGV